MQELTNEQLYKIMSIQNNLNTIFTSDNAGICQITKTEENFQYKWYMKYKRRKNNGLVFFLQGYLCLNNKHKLERC